MKYQFAKLFDIDGLQVLVTRSYQEDEEVGDHYHLKFETSAGSARVSQGHSFMTEHARDLAFHNADLKMAQSFMDTMKPFLDLDNDDDDSNTHRPSS